MLKSVRHDVPLGALNLISQEAGVDISKRGYFLIRKSGRLMIFRIFTLFMASRRPGRCLKSFLEAVRIFWTPREPVASRGDPARDQNCV